MNTKTLILISEFETALQKVNKDRVVEFFEGTHQVGQVRYEFKSEDGFTYDIHVCTLDELIRLNNTGTILFNVSNDYIMKITYDVVVTKSYRIHK